MTEIYVKVSFFSKTVKVDTEKMAFTTSDDEEFDEHFRQYVENIVFSEEVEMEIDFFDQERARAHYMKKQKDD